ncbi:MAG: hypothetical protein HW416_1826 [Chloroflexi bacterium]|nr:hypothetical protein [Chloroflexota bacterium]
MRDDQRLAHSALVAALAGEHRLRRQALQEQQEVARWRQRATFAEERGLQDLVEAARVRSERHARSAALLTARAGEMRLEIDLLRAAYDERPRIGRSPPSDPVEARFAELEIERSLEEIRKTRAGRVAPQRQTEPHD